MKGGGVGVSKQLPRRRREGPGDICQVRHAARVEEVGVTFTPYLFLRLPSYFDQYKGTFPIFGAVFKALFSRTVQEFPLNLLLPPSPSPLPLFLLSPPLSPPP